MTCEDVREQLSSFLDRELDLPSRRAVAQHLRTCADCRDASNALEAVAEAVHEAAAVPGDVLPTDVVLARIARLTRERAGAVNRVVVRQVLGGVMGVGAMLGAGLALRPVNATLRVLTLLCRPLVRGVVAEASLWTPSPLLVAALAGIAVLLIVNTLSVLGDRRL
jgi:anti-sigma factor RsiW